MGKVTITIEDSEDGTGVSVEMVADPPFNAKDDSKNTNVHYAGARAFEAIARIEDRDSTCERVNKVLNEGRALFDETD